MKVKELIEELKLHDPENECWLDVPYDEESAEAAWNTRATDPLLEKMAEAYQAACNFIDSHGCAPDITSEIGKNYVTFFRKRKSLQEYQEMKDANEQKPAG